MKYKIAPKRKILNFKKANWDALNSDLRRVRWNALLDCSEPEFAWSKFKNALFIQIGNIFLLSMLNLTLYLLSLTLIVLQLIEIKKELIKLLKRIGPFSMNLNSNQKGAF